jgi:hypothetical protein
MTMHRNEEIGRDRERGLGTGGRWWVAAFALLALGTACGGGGNNNPAPSGPVASFSPGTASPLSIAQLAGSASGTSFTVVVSATDVNDFFGAAFRIRIDPDYVALQGFSSTNSFLRDNAVPTDFRVDATTVPGQVIVSATRLQNGQGTIPGVNVVGTRELMSITFRARTFFTAAGDANANGVPDGSLEFIAPREVCDSGQPVCTPIAVSWSAGSVSAN